MSQVLSLFRLQNIDSQIDRAVSRMEIIEKLLGDDNILNKAMSDAETASSEKEKSEQKQKDIEEEIRNLNIKIDQTESSLFSGVIRNPKELQDLQKEIEALKRYSEKLEGRLLDEMMEFEIIQENFQSTSSILSSIQLERGKQNLDLIQEKSELLKNAQKLRTERIAITEVLSKDDIDLYEYLRQERRGVAVTGIQDNTCAACGTTLTLALMQSVRSPGVLTRCPSCGRILYGS